MAKKFEILSDNGRNKDSKRLLKLRKRLEMSQKQLADEWYVHAGTIGLWETGSRKIPGPVLKLIEVYEEKI